MEITYIGHSGFLIEWDSCYLLFDYYKGVIPDMNPGKKLFVFASHKHADHYNPEIFGLADRYPEIEFVLSSDIRPSAVHLKKAGDDNRITDRILSVKPSAEYVLYDNNEKIELLTLKSTDCGVAFLLKYKGKTIYHAGDLNQWVWKEETKQYNNNMTAKFNKEMEVLKNIPIDVAFVPLDPRLEDWYYMGLQKLLETTVVRYVFPMHFWDKPSIIQQFKSEYALETKATQIMEISHDGQKWKIEE
jgi:L-ascorbate metabolism protein UlaG (beta-lactamase superfamily)